MATTPLDFSSIEEKSAPPGPIDFSSIGGKRVDVTSSQGTIGPQSSTGEKIWQGIKNVAHDPFNLPAEIGSISSPLENYTQEGRAEHPILSRIGDVTKNAKDYANLVVGTMGLTGGLGIAAPAAAEDVAGVFPKIREMAMEEPDIAAQRALKPPIKKAIPTQQNLTIARPYLQGAESLEDLQTQIPAAKTEIWKPYADALEKVGDRSVKGPDGMTTVRELEMQRLEVSAQLRSAKQMKPSDLQTAMQKNEAVKALADKEKAIHAALDPELQTTGIDPKLIRKTYSGIQGVNKLVEGRNTLTESKPYGFGRTAQDFSFTKPGSWFPSLGAGAKDIIAGRPLWRGSPTDVAVKEGFRIGGEKPNLSPFPATEVKGLLPAPASELPMGGSAETLHPEMFPQKPIGVEAPHYVGRGLGGKMQRIYKGEMPPEIVGHTAEGGPMIGSPFETPLKVETDSLGVRWAISPEGYRVSIPKNIDPLDVAAYAKPKLAEQAQIHKGLEL